MMKIPFLAVFLLSQLVPTSWSAKHLLLETVDDKRNDSVAAPTPVADNSKKSGSDYMMCSTLWFLGCTDDGYDAKRIDPLCSGHSRHGAPCTT